MLNSDRPEYVLSDVGARSLKAHDGQVRSDRLEYVLSEFERDRIMKIFDVEAAIVEYLCSIPKP